MNPVRTTYNSDRTRTSQNSMPISQVNLDQLGIPPVGEPPRSQVDLAAVQLPMPEAADPFAKQQSSSLRRRLLQTILPTVLVPLAVANVLAYKLSQQQAENRVKLQLKDQALLASKGTMNVLRNAVQIPETIASNPEVIDEARESSQRVTAEKLDTLPIDQLEQRFADNRLLQANSTLNNYLNKVASSTEIAELFITERTGLNIAASNRTSDFVQRDEAWWQEAKKGSQWISEPEFDKSANTFSVDVSQAITDPRSGEFLGVVKAVLPASRFAQIEEYLRHAGLQGSQEVQLVSGGSGAVITTINSQGTSNTQDTLGGSVLKETSIAIAKAAQQPSNLEQLQQELQQKYKLQGVTIAPFKYSDDSSTLTASFTHEGKQFTLATVPKTNWVAISSINSSDIAATGANLFLILTLTFLLLGIAAAVVLLYLARQLSTPLQHLSSVAEEVAAGNLDVAAFPCGTKETQTLAQTLNNLVSRLSGFIDEQSRTAERSRLLVGVANSRILSEAQLKNVFNQALEEARHTLGADRIVIYRFNADWSGYISNESVAPGYPRALNDKIEDACIPQHLLEAYKNDRVVPTTDVFNAGFHPEHQKLMERLQIKANLVVPILNEGQLFGLLIAHHCASSHAWHATEISFLRQLAVQLGVTLERVTFIKEREGEAERSQVLKDITLQITQAETAEEILAKLPLRSTRQAMKADRVIIYRFDENWRGTITAESVDDRYPHALGAQIYDPCFEKNYVDKYKQGRIQATTNIYEAGLTTCHLNQLEPFQVKANLVAPINQGDKLLGLLIAHQCSGARYWDKAEIDFFAQVASQIGLALDRCNLLAARETAAKQARLLAEEQRQQKEAMQQQLVALLSDVEGASQGDLTVHAEVTAGEIGTVADFFNAIVESLRHIVVKVKQSAIQVSTSLESNEGSVRQLADATLKQAEETTRVLNSVKEMTRSIQAVADNAHRAATVAHTASETATTGGNAMDLTVQNVLALRETIGETAKKVKRLGESSQQISKAVSIINQIALKTNLLAINAGIEAARAGEQGQGFAVVAEEVGELAARSTTATQEIEQIVEAIQRETSEVVESMERSTSQVVEGTRLVEDTKHSLEKILDVSQQIDQLVQSISSATVSQVQISQTVSSLMQAIAQTSKQASKSSREVSNSLRQTVEVSQDLQASVGTFKVGSDV